MGPDVAAILLAAGSSARMGQQKPLLPLGDKPVIRHCLDALMPAGIRDIVVVVSAQGNGVAAALKGLPVTIAVNDLAGSDMAESVRTGLRSVEGSPSGILVCLSDHPLVSPDTVRTIIRQHGETPDSVIIPCYQEKRGHPTLFPFKIINEIFSGVTLRDIVRSHDRGVRLIDVDNEGVVLDMDTEADYRMIQKKQEGA